MVKKSNKMDAVARTIAFVFSACSKSSSSTNTNNVVATSIGSNTTLNGGAWKGTLLAGNTYTINGDITVLKTDTLTVQTGATINVPPNPTFFIQPLINSLATQPAPLTLTSPLP